MRRITVLIGLALLLASCATIKGAPPSALPRTLDEYLAQADTMTPGMCETGPTGFAGVTDPTDSTRWRLMLWVSPVTHRFVFVEWTGPDQGVVMGGMVRSDQTFEVLVGPMPVFEWADRYGARACQWLDLTNTPRGTVT